MQVPLELVVHTRDEREVQQPAALVLLAEVVHVHLRARRAVGRGDHQLLAAERAVALAVRLRVAQAHEVELEGACECSLACSTCHVILEDDLFERLPEPSDDENDMLDMAFGLSETSRLGCQVELTEDMDGAVFRIPSATRNMYVDGHVPKPH